MNLFLEFSQQRAHFERLFKIAHRMKNSENILEMERNVPWFLENENELNILVSDALLSVGTGFLPRAGGLEAQDFWFVLIFESVKKLIEEKKNEMKGGTF